LITTDKDYVKWRPLLYAIVGLKDETPPAPSPLPIFRPVLQMVLDDGSGTLDEQLNALFT
jgi:hypothetical protein